MVALDWLIYLALAFSLGAAGQLVRVVVGLKKKMDKDQETGAKSEFDHTKFWVSIVLGALAGMMTGIATLDYTQAQLDGNFVLTLMAAGYAGSDIIEGLIEKKLKSLSS